MSSYDLKLKTCLIKQTSHVTTSLKSALLKPLIEHVTIYLDVMHHTYYFLIALV